MKSLSDYIFTAGGTVSNKILIFDVDDTLINTTAEIGITLNGKIIKHIPNKKFNTYKPKPGEWFDFSEFNDPKILARETFTKYWSTLKREYARGTHICILTARGDASMIRDFFLKNGIDIKKELVLAVGDPKFGFTGSVSEKKAQAFKQLVRYGYKTFVVFDDCEENLQAMKKLEGNGVRVIVNKV